MTASRLSFAVSIVVLLLPAFAVAGGVITISKAEFREEFSDQVAVSGEVRVGVVAGDARRPAAGEPLSLQVNLPADGPRRLCLRMTSRDGRYRAEGSVRLTEDQVGETTISAPTEKGDQLRNAEDDYLAPMVTLSDDERCRGKVQVILPARWPGEKGGGGVRVLVNSGGLSTTISYSDQAGRVSRECTALTGTHLLAFDTVCGIPSLSEARGIVIERHEFSDILRVPLPLAGSASTKR